MISNSNRDFITGMVVSKSGILNLEIGETGGIYSLHITPISASLITVT